MEKSRIEELLEKYWLCETTVSEEQELCHFFNGSEVPEHLSKYTELFVYNKEESEVTLDEGFEERILEMISKEKKKQRPTLKPLVQFAAAVAVLFVCWFTTNLFVQPSDPWSRETYETPEQALAEVQKIFSDLSGHIEKGQTMVDRSMEKIGPITQIIK
ncbi:hypothetical protein LJC05_02685 [Bacteroides sp. OttesenSCG-928-J23]|nr:hypothetical protein [Bacteroides sp. OttesenSCG-928-J23]